MRRWGIMLTLLVLLCIPVRALEITAPEVPAAGASRMPENTQSFSDAILEILGDALTSVRPDLREAAVSCLGVLASAAVISVVSAFPAHRQNVTELVGTLIAGTLLLRSANALIRLGAQTVTELSEYGKLLLPVMAAAQAAQGGITSASAIYAGTAAFDAVLSALIARAMIPMIYLFLALAVGAAAIQDPMLQKLQGSIRSVCIWCLKTVLYVYTGYISITGVVSGTTDASALKAAKLTISGVVPVVGGILSDASEAVLVSAGTVKNAAGIYGLLAILAVWIGPFLKIGAHYLILKAVHTVCAVFGVRSVTALTGDFSTAMGLLLAMTGTVCLMLMVSTVCFMKGVGI